MKKWIIGIDEVGRAAKKRRASPKRYIIGIDEVGRGPLAGPITVVALATTVNIKLQISNLKNKKLKLKDSKKLSALQREQWFHYMQKLKKEKKIFYQIVSIAPNIIDKINITRAANRAATQAYEKLKTKNSKHIKKHVVLLDGGLYLQESYKGIGKTIIKGDEKIPAISLASIIAKVTRDKYMTKMHKKYPQYGFESHKGYGTRAHYRALARYGASPLHRKTFLNKKKKV